MKRLFCYAEKYIAKSDWKDLAMLKFCLFAMGVLDGMRIPERNRRQAGWIATAIFAQVLAINSECLFCSFRGLLGFTV